MNQEKVTTEAAPEATIAPTPDAGITEPNIFTRFTRAIDRALAVKPELAGPALMCFTLLDNSGGQGQILTPGMLEKLNGWQNQHDAALEIILTHTPEKAYEDWQTHQDGLIKAVQDKNLHEKSPYGREDFEAQMVHKADAARLEVRRLYKEAFPLCSRIGSRFVEIAQKKLERQERTEREQHEYYGIAYTTPSAIILNFRNAIRFAKHRIEWNEYGEASPKQMCPYLIF